MWVYTRTEQQLWTVGFFAPDGEWQTDSDHTEQEEAAKRVAFLNGSYEELTERFVLIERRVAELEQKEVSVYEAAYEAAMNAVRAGRFAK